ncbi:hypothetical protein PFISCL1PPCAC_13433, partial [Pristionchus fissidentatus]
MFMMSIERRAASMRFATYEKTSKYYGYKLTLIRLVATSVLSATCLLTYGYSTPFVVYCTITTPRGENFHQCVALLLMIIEIWTIVTFERMLRKNRKRMEKEDALTLSERYQISENVRMLRIMLPVVWSHTSLTCITAVIYLIGVANGLADRNFPLFEVSSIIYTFEPIYIEIKLFSIYRKGARHNREVIVTNSATGEELHAVHSAAIQAAWR